MGKLFACSKKKYWHRCTARPWCTPYTAATRHTYNLPLTLMPNAVSNKWLLKENTIDGLGKMCEKLREMCEK